MPLHITCSNNTFPRQALGANQHHHVRTDKHADGQVIYGSVTPIQLGHFLICCQSIMRERVSIHLPHSAPIIHATVHAIVHAAFHAISHASVHVTVHVIVCDAVHTAI